MAIRKPRNAPASGSEWISHDKNQVVVVVDTRNVNKHFGNVTWKVSYYPKHRLNPDTVGGSGQIGLDAFLNAFRPNTPEAEGIYLLKQMDVKPSNFFGDRDGDHDL